MRLFRHFTDFPSDARGAVLAAGNFDGVHRGHQAVIRQAGEIAAAAGRAFGVVTFEPHPRQLFRPADPPFRLTPFHDKAHQIAMLGCDLMVSLTFDAALARQTADAFVTEVLHDGLGAGHIVVGYDFVFGRGRQGDAALLGRLGDALGFGMTALAPVIGPAGIACSSTEIRRLLAIGSPREAARQLGRAWEIGGRVRHGDARGRLIGFPTANIELGEYLRPAAGVYAVWVGIEQGQTTQWHRGVANIGTRPTVAGSDLRLEAHLFDFSGDLYGRRLRVALIDWLRPERRFAGLDELTAQIAADAASARAIMANAAPPA
jgi:riboflavin kinase/FMN adenylyltransferase